LTPLKRSSENPIIKAEKPWEVQVAWTSVFRDPQTGKYQMWYQAWNGDRARERTHNSVVAYAESSDGVHFTKPNLGLFQFNDVATTNIVLLSNGGHSYRYANSVVHDPRDPDPAKRYKMGYFDWATDEGQEYPGFCVAFSPDGIHWTKHPKAPLLKIAYADPGLTVPFADEAKAKPWLLSLTMSDAVDIFFDPKRELFTYYGKMWIDGPEGTMSWKHAMGRSESKDFINWSKPHVVLTPDDHDPPHVEFHTSPVFFYKDVYFCLNQILDRSTGGGVIDIELMTSRDGLTWERPFRGEPFLSRAEGGAFDSGSLFVSTPPVVLEDELRFYYGAHKEGATHHADFYSVTTGIGLATLPLDRFAGIQPIARAGQGALPASPRERVGQVTLKPIDFRAVSGISLNADASHGAIRVELLDADGNRVRGFGREDTVPLTGDSPRHEVKWNGKALADLPPGMYMPRIHLESATVYALDLFGT
ncbi:MAG: hypothetical protein ABIP55_17040, partial [Tepidisphaeraceae bacterium]